MTASFSQRTNESLLATLITTQQRYQLLPPGADRVVVVAVSGGPDSACLLHLLHELRYAWRLSLHVAHLDHGLRPDSAADAEFVANLAVNLALPFHTKRLTPEERTATGKGLEATIRAARYHFLWTTAINVTPADRVPIVAVGHHADDQAETVLLHLLQGSGLEGLGAMRPVANLPGASTAEPPKVRLIRPLLFVRRERIIDHLKQHNLSWREDPTNADQRYTRNRLRHAVLPLLATVNPRVAETLARTATILADEAARVDKLNRALLQELCLESSPGRRIVLDLKRWMALPVAERRGVIRVALADLVHDRRQIGFELGETLVWMSAPDAVTSGPHPLAAGVEWSTVGATPTAPARLSLHQKDTHPFAPSGPWLDKSWRNEVRAASVPVPGACKIDGWRLESKLLPIVALPPNWQTNSDPWRAFLDLSAFETLVVRPPEPGLHFAPLGMAGHKRSLGDTFTNHKVPPTLRAGWPLVVDQSTGQVLWICGIQLAHHVRVTDRTTQVVELSWVQIRPDTA